MFLDQIPSDEDVETVVVVVELVYLKVFYSITLFMDPNIRERWASLPLLRVESLKNHYNPI